MTSCRVPLCAFGTRELLLRGTIISTFGKIKPQKVLWGVKQASLLLFVSLLAVQMFYNQQRCQIKQDRGSPRERMGGKKGISLKMYICILVFSLLTNNLTISSPNRGFVITSYKLLIHFSSIVKQVCLIFPHWFNKFILYSVNTSSTSLVYYWLSHYAFSHYTTLGAQYKVILNIQLNKACMSNLTQRFHILKMLICWSKN